MRLWPIGLIFSLAAPVAASDLVLDWPVDCTLGSDCHIQQYVDHDPSPATRDFTCNGLTYDGHKGTDIALPSLAEMRSGVSVLAAAGGVVAGARDSMADQYATGENAAAVRGRECGNGVLIRHDGGWETQYCHMRRGSIAVSQGDRVEPGTILGQVGLSGNTEFPHLHLTVRHNGKTIDPFIPSMTADCRTAPDADALWRDDIPYEPGGFIASGFSDHVPKFATIKEGTADQAPLPAGASALVYWAYAFGSRTGDRLQLDITGPNGPVLQQEDQLEKPQAQLFRAAGRRIRGVGLQPGLYQATATLIRAGKIIDTAQRSMLVE
ncbi:M23 family metallopeptidase [Phaeobacter sp.]|uniref:M23 family metallopeptidase n=1 Tax=Phaeobacter sp. TaxID=1902409 RepID=UPI0025DFBC0D|nr:M23 family metallopeptidase [Phaeobacter sp.]